MRFLAIGFVSLLFGLAACGTDEVDAPPPEESARATWYQDVAPILSQHCMTCHQAGGIAPFVLTDYDSAKEMSAFALDAIARGIMPPFDAREEADCTPRFGWVDDPRLSNREKETLQNWVDDGHPLGEVAEIPAIPVADLPNPTMRLTPTEGFVTSGDRDQFICYILDPGNTQTAFLTGLQVLPDNELVVHHAVIGELAPGAEQDALVLANGIGLPFDCSTMSTPSDFVVHIWTPGNQPMQTDGNIAVPLVANAKLVMQIHYHPAGLVHDADRTALDLRLTSTVPERLYFVGALGNFNAAPLLLPGPGDTNGPQFLIPRNVADHSEHMRVQLPAGLFDAANDVRVFAANPHMHLIGTHISATIERPQARGSDPQSECLANGAWNFDWQRSYQYDAPPNAQPSLQAGDIVDIKCKWNNTLENPFVQRMLADSGLSQPIDVLLGEQTTNEMCLEIFGLTLPASVLQKPDRSLEIPAGLAQMKVNANMLQ